MKDSGGRVRRTEVTLRDVRDDDIPVFYRHQSDPIAARMAQVAQRDQASYLAHWKKLLADPTVGKKSVLVDRALAGQVISFVRDGVRELGYWIGREYWGQGVARAAVRQYLSFEHHRPLYAVVAPHNTASVRVLTGCGFTALESSGEALHFILSGEAPLLLEIGSV